MAEVMRIPQNLVEAKKAFELFTCRNGSDITVQVWNKAWRQTCPSGQAMDDWEMSILQCRVSASSGRRKQPHNVSRNSESATVPGTIDYALQLVHIFDT